MLSTLFYLLIFFLSLGQLERISLFNQQFNLYVHELILIGIVSYLSFQFKRQHSKLSEKQKILFKSFFAFIAVLAVSLLFESWKYTLFQNFIGLSYLLRFFLYGFFLLLCFTIPKKDIHSIQLTRSMWMYVGLVIVTSILQFFLYPDLRNLKYLGWDPHHFRLFGLYFDTTILGIIFSVLFFWVANQSFERIKKYVLLVLLTLLILFTYSRITYLVFIVSLIVYYKKYIKLLYIICGVALFVAALFFLPRPQGESVNLQRVFTIQARMHDNIDGFTLFLKRPILGYGYDRLKYVRDTDPSSHASGAFSSSFLTILVSSGIVGLIFFLNWMYQLYKYTGVKTGVFFIIVLVSSLFDNVILTNFTLLIFYLVLIQNYYSGE